MKRSIIVCGLPLVVLASSALGQFAVIDVAAIAKLKDQLTTAASTLSQITATYNRVTQQYNQAVYMAQYLRNLSGYRMTMTPWQGMSATNTSGTISGWLNSINTGLNVTGGWLNSTYARPSFSALSSVLPTVQKLRAQMDYGTLELRDGTSQAAMQTIGSLRLHGTQSEAALSKLESDSESPDPDLNTTAALLNKINAAGVVNARLAADANKALVNAAEMQLVDMKARHDAEAAAAEDEIAFRTTGMATIRAQHAGFNDAMKNFEIQ